MMFYSCGVSEPSVQFEKIELLKNDNLKPLDIANELLLSKNKIVAISCLTLLPKAIIDIKSIEILDKKIGIIPAEIIAGKNAMLAKVIYPEIAKRAEIEGLVALDFTVDKLGIVKEIEIIKDIGGFCGETAKKSVLETKFKPATFNRNSIVSKYRIIFEFKMNPVH